MATNVGVGFSELPNSKDAGRESVSMAMRKAGIEQCDLVLMFATTKHDPVQLRDGVREIVGPAARLIGGASLGAITNDQLGYEGHQVGVAVLSSDSVQVDLFKERGIAGREFEAGAAFGSRFAGTTFDGRPNLFLMYDLFKNEDAEVNLTSPLLRGIEDKIGTWPQTAGLGFMGNLQLTPGFHWFDDEVEGQCPDGQSVLGFSLSGEIQMDAVILHGCLPASSYFTITKSEGNLVLELDGAPATDVIGDLLGRGEDAWRDWPSFIIFGINRGEKFGEYREDDYTVRFCTAVDVKRKGFVVVADDLRPGTEIQLMRRDMMFGSMEGRIRSVFDSLNGRHPVFALYVDCAGRTAAISETDREDAEEVQKVVGELPLLGMYSGVEIARVGTGIDQNNYTGVFCLFSEPA